MTNEYLRHTLATINYRFQKSVKDAQEGFGEFSLGKDSRTPSEIINHMYYVLKATSVFVAEERQLKEVPELLPLEGEVNRFNNEINNLSSILAKTELPINYAKKLLQGPLSDMLTHIGQIAMLSRIHGTPIVGEDFSAATIHIKT